MTKKLGKFCLPHIVVILVFVLPLAGSCSGGGTKEPKIIVFDLSLDRNVDILFVIDDSGTMEGEQESLNTNFPRFVAILEGIEGGLPDLHIGVVSTDVGIGRDLPGDACSGNGSLGKNGILQADPLVKGCSPPSDRFISSISNPDEPKSPPTVNFSGTLVETFSCIAKLGTNGCGFEQPLEAMRRALDGSNEENQGFLRDNSLLAVIFVTDEDDCSATNGDLFVADESVLGPLGSFRCFEQGVVCDPDSQAVGPRSDCVSREDSTFLNSVQEYSNFLLGLKRSNDLIVAGIIGDSTPVAVGSRTDNQGERLTVEPVCGVIVDQSAAFPGIRLSQFINSFQQSAVSSICGANLGAALEEIAPLIADSIGPRCIDGDLKLTDGVPECSVFFSVDDDTSDVESCNAAQNNLPCFHFEQNLERCGTTPTQLAIVIERDPNLPELVGSAEAHCIANDSPPSSGS